MSVQMTKGRKPISHLIQDLEDGVISEADREYLMDCMRKSSGVRKLYMKHAKMAALLTEAAESRAAMGAIPISQERLFHEKRRIRFSTIVTGMAAMLIAALGVMFFYGPQLRFGLSGVAKAEGANDASYFVSHSSGGARLGDGLLPGDRLNLSSGLLKLTFDSGVEALIEGPSDIEIVSDSEIVMSGGLGWFRVPEAGHGFTVSTSHSKIVDYGTEFGVRAGDSGVLEVHVADGLVGVDPNSEAVPETKLNGGEAVRVDELGKMETIPLQLGMFRTQFVGDWDYIHWSFDEIIDGAFPADGPIAQVVDGAARVKLLNGENLRSPQISKALTQGVRGNAFSMKMDGVYAETNYPGIGSNVPRTVAGWVRHRGNLPQRAAGLKWPGTIESVSSGELIRGTRAPEGKQGFVAAYTNSGIVSRKSAIKEPIHAGMTYTLSVQLSPLIGEASATGLVELVAFDPSLKDQARRDCRRSYLEKPRAEQGLLLIESNISVTQHQAPVTAVLEFTAEEGQPYIGKSLAIRMCKSIGPIIYDNVELTVHKYGNAKSPRLLFADDFESPKVDGFAVKQAPSNWVSANKGYGAELSGLYNQGEVNEAPYLAWGSPQKGAMWSVCLEGRAGVEWGVDMGNLTLWAPNPIESSATDWNHIAMVYTGRVDAQGVPEVLYYLNGERVQGASGVQAARSASAQRLVDTDILSDAAESLRFGVGLGESNISANGDLDEVYLFRGVLNEDQIKNLMNGERP